MLDFETQCCDAADYLGLGSHCAAGGNCINDLRPLGSVLWFAWPEYVGIAQQAVLYVALALFMLSIALSAKVAINSIRKFTQLPRFSYIVLLLISTGIHYFFFAPVLWVSLSDAPAGLFALNGCWIVLLSWSARSWRLALGLAIGGLLLGLAVWVRAFNLYPLLVVLAVYVLTWCFRKQRRAAELLLLTALLPIAAQYAAIFYKFDALGFISPNTSSSWTKTHLTDEAIGYDTLTPHTGLRYFSHCPREGGLLGAIEKRDFNAYMCVIKHRLNFYWGSDLRYTYIVAKNPHNMVNYPERLDEPVYWLRQHIHAEPDSALAPNGRLEAEVFKLTTEHFNSGYPKEVFTGVSIGEPGVHTLSAWLWSPKPKLMDVVLLNQHNHVLLEERVQLTPEPKRYHFSALIPDHYIIVLFRANSNLPEELGSELDDSFSIWGVQLEQGDQLSAYSLATSDDLHRQYSTVLLGLNIALSVLALVLLLRKPLRTVPYISVALFVVLSFGQALIIVPEQRFIIVPQVIVWLFGICSLAIFLLRKKQLSA